MSKLTRTPRPMRAALLGFNERLRNTLLMFFENRGKSLCEIVSERDCEIGIIDFDSFEGKRIWPQFIDRGPRPALVLSVSERDLPGALWVRKPLDFDTLSEALERLRHLLEQSGEAIVDTLADPQDATPPVPPLTPVTFTLPRPDAPRPIAAEDPANPPSRPTAALAPTPAPSSPRHTSLLAPADARAPYYERDLRANFGDRADAAYLDPARDDELFYDPENYIQGTLTRAWRKTVETGRPHGVTGLGKPLVLLPDRELLVTPMRDAYLRGLCIQSSRTVQTAIVPVVESSELTDPQPGTTRRLDDTLWKVALWTSRGRVPIGTQLDRPVALRGWPNFTRISNPPHALQVVATWSRTPLPLRQTAELLGVPYRAVFALYCGCHALGLIDTHAAPSKSAPPPQGEVQTEKRRALLGALLRKLA